MQDSTSEFGGLDIRHEVVIVQGVAGAAGDFQDGGPPMYLLKVRGATAADRTRVIEQTYAWDVDDLCALLVRLAELVVDTGQGDKLKGLLMDWMSGLLSPPETS